MRSTLVMFLEFTDVIVVEQEKSIHNVQWNQIALMVFILKAILIRVKKQNGTHKNI